MVWGRTKKNVRNGGWIDYSNGKGNGGNAAGADSVLGRIAGIHGVPRMRVRRR